MSKLTDKQEMFCREYLIDLNATQAAIRAGYSQKTANAQAGRLLVNVSIQNRIAELKEERNKRTGIDADWVLNNAKRVFERCMQDEPILTASGDPLMTKTANGELACAYKFDSTGANRSLELIGKHVDVQAFKEKIEIEASEQMTPWGLIKAGVDE